MPKFFQLLGKTGSGKTRILAHLKLLGQQVIDIEAISQHNGSVFGLKCKSNKLNQKDFELNLVEFFNNFSDLKPVFLEYKGHKIGDYILPFWYKNIIDNATQILIETPLQLRLRNIADDYSHLTISDLINSISKINTKMPENIFKNALQSLENEDIKAFYQNMIEYYDNTPSYNFSNKKIDLQLIFEQNNIEQVANEILKFTK